MAVNGRPFWGLDVEVKMSSHSSTHLFLAGTKHKASTKLRTQSSYKGAGFAEVAENTLEEIYSAVTVLL